ncbi:MAG: YdeI/OmpD-associated family protein [Giesbergeria sp.]
MIDKPHHSFETPEQLHAWLQVNHASEPELWVRIFKKATGQPSGTWAAYAGSATMVMPADFLAALQQDPAAHAFYATLKRASQFTIYHRLHSAKRPETRQKRMAELLAKLAHGESP